MEYKLYIKNCQKEDNNFDSNELHEALALKSVWSFWKTSATTYKQIYVYGIDHDSVIEDKFPSFLEATSSSFSEKQSQIVRSQYEAFRKYNVPHESENNNVYAELIRSILENPSAGKAVWLDHSQYVCVYNL